MRFLETALEGVYAIEPELAVDERGAFARIWCRREFADHGLDSRLAQCSLSWNPSHGTLRGLHYQVYPHEEAKLVRVTSGTIFDVALDLRPGSATFGKYATAILGARERTMLFVPAGCAHGFLTLEDETEVAYHISEFYEPNSARGVRFDDPAFGIEWPSAPRIISARDRSYPDVNLAELGRDR